MQGDESIHWAELAGRIQREDASAEEVFAAYFHPRVLAIATLRLRDPDAAREIAQETLIVVFQALRESRVREPEKLPAFVYGTARYLMNNHTRAKSHTPDGPPISATLADPADLSADIEQKEKLRLVEGVLHKLNPVDRKILLLTLVEGMHPREIAPRVGLTAENVRARKMRAIRTLIEKVEKLSRK